MHHFVRISCVVAMLRPKHFLSIFDMLENSSFTYTCIVWRRFEINIARKGIVTASMSRYNAQSPVFDVFEFPVTLVS